MKKQLLLLSFVLIFSTCKKDDPKPVQPTQPDIYICGMEGVGNLYFVAKYWKNGVETVVDNATVPNAYVNAMAVSGDEVYLAGYQLKGTMFVFASYWKNKVATALTDGWGIATSIAVDGSDVYVAGSELKGTYNVAKYWKNGVAVPLTDGTTEANANSITVVGKDVYVAGYDGSIAKYWKNGISTELTNGNYRASTVSIGVSGTDVYVLGYEDSATGKEAKYWKSGTPTYVADGETTELSQITVASNDVYICGSILNAAFYWKNGVAVPLTDGTHLARANGIAVHAGDVYVVGYEDNDKGVRVGKLWKNGVATNFAGSDDSNEPLAIVVH